MKRFPIQAESRREESGRVIQIPRIMIPWSVAEKAFEVYHEMYGTQTLERLAERGGFGRDEFLQYLGEAE